MSRTIFILCFCLGQWGLCAQTADEFIQMTMSYDPGLEALRLDYEAASKKVDQVGEWPDPTVNVAIGVLPIETRLGAQRFKLGVTQMIPWKGSLKAQKEVASSSALAKSTLDEVQEIEIAYIIRTTYAQLQFLETQKGIIHAKLGVLEILMELAKSNVRSGKASISDVLLIERNKTALTSDLELLEQKKEQPQILLNRWSGRDLSAAIDLDEDQDMSRNSILSSINLEQHPQFTVLEHQIAASNSLINLTQFQSKPQIGVGLEYAYISRRNDVEIPRNGRDIIMPMGSIRIPLFTEKYDAVRQEEKIKQEAIASKRSAFENQFHSEIELANSQIKYADAAIVKFSQLKALTAETIELLKEEYAAEKTSMENLLKYEMDVFDYDFQILKAHFDKKIAMASLLKFNL